MGEDKSVDELVDLLNKLIENLQKAPFQGEGSIYPVRKIVDSLSKTAKELGNAGDERAVRPLLDMLKETDRRIMNERFWKTEVKWAGQAAIYALMKIGGDAAVEGLCTIIDLDNLELRLSVSRVLAASKNELVISALKSSMLHIEVDNSTGEIIAPVLKMNERAEPVELKRVAIRKHCVWCERLKDPEFFDPKYSMGGGYCNFNNGPTELRSTCNSFEVNGRGSWWLQTNYMKQKYPQVSVWWKTVD